jgi:putative FmdB family regulatory protein
MPTYEYRCSSGHEFEQFQRMSEPPLTECPQCGAPAERMLSAGGGLLFKGSGFYITDYRSDSYRKAAEADSGKGSGSAGAADAAPKGGAKESSGEGKAAPKKESGGASSSSPKAE